MDAVPITAIIATNSLFISLNFSTLNFQFSTFNFPLDRRSLAARLCRFHKAQRLKEPKGRKNYLLPPKLPPPLERLPPKLPPPPLERLPPTLLLPPKLPPPDELLLEVVIVGV
jgi:hypothetical protein